MAEELVLGHMTTGAGNDIEKATELARRMVCEWGMSERLGPMTFGKKEEQIFLGRDFTQVQDYSDQTAVEIDDEVRRILQESYERARTLLEENIDLLHAMAELLLEREVHRRCGDRRDSCARAATASAPELRAPPARIRARERGCAGSRWPSRRWSTPARSARRASGMGAEHPGAGARRRGGAPGTL